MPRPAPKTVQQLRDKIRAEELIDTAQASVLDGGKPLSTGEVGVIKLLLNKVIPDLKGIEVKAEVDGDVHFTWDK